MNLKLLPILFLIISYLYAVDVIDNGLSPPAKQKLLSKTSYSQDLTNHMDKDEFIRLLTKDVEGFDKASVINH